MAAAIRSISGSIIEWLVDVQSSSINAWVGRRMRIRRASLGMSNQECCESPGIDSDEISAYDAGKKRIGPNLLFRIANLLDVKPHHFFQDYTAEELSARQESPL